MVKNSSLFFIILTFTSLIFQVAYAIDTKVKNEPLPWREKYPLVKWVDLTEFSETHDKYIVIDVRTQEEFDVIHIKNAHLANISNYSFNLVLKKLLRKYPNKPFVFYCNGHQCNKSYIAVIKAKKTFHIDATVFDAGILDFARVNPQDTILLGKPISNKNKIIPKEEYTAHVIDYLQLLDFKNSALVIDIRDVNRRDYIPKDIAIRNIPFVRLLESLQQKKIKLQKLIFIDETGQQTRWLQYYLKQAGVKDYFFLEGGISAWKNL